MSKSRNKFILIISRILAVVLLSVLAGFVLGRIDNDNAEDIASLTYEERIPPDRKPEDYYFTLGYMPEGFEIIEVQSSKNGYYNLFLNKEDKDIWFNVDKEIIPQQFFINTENAKIKYIDINGNKALFSSNSRVNILAWIEGNRYRITIAGTIDEKTMKKIAENLE